MPTTGDAGRDLIWLGLIVVGVIGYVGTECVEYALREFAAWSAHNRREEIRAAIEKGDYFGYPEGELLEELYRKVARDQEEIAAATDRALRKLRGPDAHGTVESPAQDARNLFVDIALRLDSSSTEDAVATLAFILQRTAMQVRALSRGEGFLPVFEYLLELRQAELDVASGRRSFRFDSLPSAVYLLCKLRRGMQGAIEGVLRQYRPRPLPRPSRSR